MKKLLVIGYVWPEPKASAAGSRMLQLITLFQEYSYTVYFGSPNVKPDKATNLELLGIQIVDMELNDSSFDIMVADLNPDIVLFDRFMMEEQFGWRISEFCPEALRILDTEDLHSLRNSRQMALKEGTEFNENYWLGFELTKRELASIYRCDLSLIISEEEMKWLSMVIPNNNLLYYLPFIEEPVSNTKKKGLAGFENRKNFVAIGNFLHAPNRDAVEYLKQVIWPLIRRKLPQAELHIYGAYMNSKTQELNNPKEGFLVKGFCENVDETMSQARICLVPLRFGAGLKGKIIDAMKNGTPCGMTSVAAEGMFGNLSPNGFVEDDVEKFTEKIIRLYTDKEWWTNSKENGFLVLNTRFNKMQFTKLFIAHLEGLKNKIEDHRLTNITGRILEYNAFKSTKYMAKWIEEKNKK